MRNLILHTKKPPQMCTKTQRAIDNNFRQLVETPFPIKGLYNLGDNIKKALPCQANICCSLNFTCKKPCLLRYATFGNTVLAQAWAFLDMSIYPMRFFISSATLLIPPIPNFSTNTLVTFGDRNAGSVGPRWIFFTPKCSRASNTMTAFCSYQAIL